eukprot:g27175.t1
MRKPSFVSNLDIGHVSQDPGNPNSATGQAVRRLVGSRSAGLLNTSRCPRAMCQMRGVPGDCVRKVLFEMFLKAEVPKCVVTGEPITFFPNVCTALHHFMLDVYKKDLKGRKAIEESILAVFNLKVPSIADAPDEDGDDGLMEEFSGRWRWFRSVLPLQWDGRERPCHPSGRLQKGPEPTVLRIFFFKPSARTKFPSQYKALEAKNAGVELVPQPTCSDFPADAYVHLGLGCDGCGLWPIRGVAYEDVDCRSATGFHLCEACYELGYHKRVLGGRFNQGHMPKNTMCRVIPAGY